MPDAVLLTLIGKMRECGRFRLLRSRGELTTRYGGDLLGNAVHVYDLTHDSDMEAEQMAERLNDMDIPRRSPLPKSSNQVPAPTPATPPVTNPSTHRQKTYYFDEHAAQDQVSPVVPPTQPIRVRGTAVSGCNIQPPAVPFIFDTSDTHPWFGGNLGRGSER